MIDKRYYTRYPLICDALVALESGLTFSAEIRDLSIEGARLRIYGNPFIKEGDIIFLNIKCKYKIKLKAQVRWIKNSDKWIEFGVKFLEISMQDQETLSQLLSEYALTTISDVYLK
ncbi:MAG: PilZ domain-containing protein [Caldimicrobium thiodismutans]